MTDRLIRITTAAAVATVAAVAAVISYRHAYELVNQLESAGLSRSEAIRRAIIDSAARLQKRRALAEEVAALEADGGRPPGNAGSGGPHGEHACSGVTSTSSGCRVVKDLSSAAGGSVSWSNEFLPRSVVLVAPTSRSQARLVPPGDRPAR